MGNKFTKGAFSVIVVILMVVAFAGVRSNQKDRVNRVIDRENVEGMDKYLPDEVMTTWYGQVGITNVEEYGANNGKVSAKIHYKNTTGTPLDLAPSDFGAFLDEDYYYTIHGERDLIERYEPGDIGEFEVTINRKEGLEGLYYVLKEPGREGMLDGQSESPYIGGIELSLLMDDEKAKKEMYGISEDYTEEYQEDSVGNSLEYASAISTMEDIIMQEDKASKLAEEQKRDRDNMEKRRKDALESIKN